MERPWISKLWRQTASNSKVDGSATALTKTFEEIATHTAKLIEQPYNAGLWAARARLLGGVGYPELAAGDARKAQKLLAAMLDGKGLGLAARKQIMETPGVPKAPSIIMQDQRFWKDFVKKFDFQNFMTLASALSQAGAYHSFREMCIEVRAMYPGDGIFAGGLASSTEALKDYRRALQQSPLTKDGNVDEQLKFGNVLFRQYPFMKPEYIHRSAELIANSNARLLAIGAPCIIRASNLGSSAPISAPAPPSKLLSGWNSFKEFLGVKIESPTLGLFATSDIQKGDVILRDSTTWSANTLPAIVRLGTRYMGRTQPSLTMHRCDNCCGVQPTWQKTTYRSKCCNTTYCSNDCLETAKKTYHQVLCGKDFSWLAKKPQPAGVKNVPVGISDTDGHIWLRILATCVQSGLHPLEHPSIASLTPNYESPDEVGRRWSLASHIDVPQKILTTLGVDIFKDLRYDTWVLQTIWARITNNSIGRVDKKGLDVPVASRAVNPLYSFINHSCEPNAGAKDVFETYPPQTAPVMGSSTLAVIAKRRIKAGEEIYVSYIDEHQNRSQRNFLLRNNWLSGECKCTKCLREIRSEKST